VGRAGWLIVATALLLSPAMPARAAYPDHPIHIVVPFPAGGSVDTLARQIGQRLATRWGQGVVVENRAGANSVIGSNDVAKAAPDGYTLLINASNLVINQHLLKTPYDPDTDFAPVALLAKGAMIVAATPSLPARNFSELVALARAKPDTLNFAIGSNGSPGHIATELLMRRAAIRLFVVPYKGSTPAYQDLVGGQISGMVEPALGIMPFIQSGTIRALAVTSAQRIDALPDIPTVAESGVPGFEFYSWYGLWAPGGTRPELVEVLNGAVNRVLAAADLRAQLAAQGFTSQDGTPGDFTKLLQAESHTIGLIVREANIKAE
jgi:tripartite-type tricarboxylate transporter receptor subunit TctC